MIQLSEHFTYKKLARFTTAPILMMIFTSIYVVVDGLFVSIFVVDEAFTALNLVYPFISVLGAVGFMFGAGGTAIVSKTLGEKQNELAKKYFTLLVIVTAVVGAALAAIGIAVLKPVSVLLGADEKTLPYCISYGTVMLIGLPFFMLQNMFQSFFTTAEKPKLGFLVTLICGVSNMALDALFVVVFKWGLVGAAAATVVCQGIGGIVPIVYFSCKNTSLLRFSKPCFYGKVVLKACTNGSSELLSNIAMSLVSMLYNKQLIRLVGNDGVDAFGVVMYVQFIFVAIFIGYCIGVTPIVGYNFGSQNKVELQSLFAKTLKIIAVSAVLMTALGVGLSKPITMLFTLKKPHISEMSAHAMRLYSICFLFVGFNMFGSAFFTALNNGLVSAILSFSRTLVFQVLCIFVLPLFLGLDGIWLATVVAEVLAFALTVTMFAVNKKRYGYVRSPLARIAK